MNLTRTLYLFRISFKIGLVKNTRYIIMTKKFTLVSFVFLIQLIDTQNLQDPKEFVTKIIYFNHTVAKNSDSHPLKEQTVENYQKWHRCHKNLRISKYRHKKIKRRLAHNKLKLRKQTEWSKILTSRLEKRRCYKFEPENKNFLVSEKKFAQCIFTKIPPFPKRFSRKKFQCQPNFTRAIINLGSLNECLSEKLRQIKNFIGRRREELQKLKILRRDVSCRRFKTGRKRGRRNRVRVRKTGEQKRARKLFRGKPVRRHSKQLKIF